MNFENNFPQFVYIVIGLLFLASVFLTWFRYRKSLKDSYLFGIISLRTISLCLVLLFGLKPYLVDEVADYESFTVSVLVDNSGSMDSQDCAGKSRLVTASELVSSEKSWLKEKTKNFNLTFHSFAARLGALPTEGELNSQVGGTNIEAALDKMTEAANRGSLGAVVLLTDGQETAGNSISAAKKLRLAGVPVTVVGIGGESALEDVALAFYTTPKSYNKNKEFELLVKVKKNTSQELNEEVVLSSNGIEIGRQNLSLPVGVAEELISFKVREYTSGFKNYRAAIKVVPGEMIHSNNVDYAAVDITEDEKVKVLYFAANLNWEYKYLDKLCDDSENLEMSALIRTGEKAWYYYAGKEEKKFNVFPETTELIDYDVIIFDLAAEYLILEKVAGNIERFAFDKGGGLLFTGRAQKNSRFSSLMPISNIQPNSASGKKVMQLADNSLLVPRTRKDLTDLSDILYVKSGKRFFTGKLQDLKTSARLDLSLRGSSKNVILSSLYYGAGRTAYLGTETWPWKMNPDNEGEHYDIFWKRLFTWLSSSSVEQLKVLPAYRKFAAGEVMDLAIDLLDPDFEPSLTADVEVILKSPSGKVNTIKLPSSLDVEGRYSLDYIPAESGEYSLSVNVTFADDSKLSHKVAFLAAEASGENGTFPLHKRLLEDITRVTGGKYVNWQEALMGELPLSQKIPLIQSRTYYLSSWLVMSLILALFCTEWFLRRRIGLR
jgi:hypothetical protein